MNYANPASNSTAYQLANPLQTTPVPSGTSGIWVTPQDYGAVGDGVTDDTASIQNAIAGAHALGCELHFQACAHLVAGTLYVPAGLTIRGVPNWSMIQSTGSGPLLQLAAVSWPTNTITIENLYLQGPWAGGSPDSTCAILCNGTGDGSAYTRLAGLGIVGFSQGVDGCLSSGLIENCFIGSCYYPIRIGSTSNYTTIRGCKILGNTYGPYCLSGPIIENCDIEACTQEAIHIPVGGWVTDCHLEGNNTSIKGIVLGNGAYISHNYFAGFGTAIYVDGVAYDMIIRENFFAGNTTNIDYGRSLGGGYLLMMANYYLNGSNISAGASGNYREITTANLVHDLVIP